MNELAQINRVADCLHGEAHREGGAFKGAPDLQDVASCKASLTHPRAWVNARLSLSTLPAITQCIAGAFSQAKHSHRFTLNTLIVLGASFSGVKSPLDTRSETYLPCTLNTFLASLMGAGPLFTFRAKLLSNFQ